jgi:SAM-dependent methyltransferase
MLDESMFPTTDRDILRRQAYATDDNWRVRYETHEKYSVPKLDFAQWALSQMLWRGDEQVLDVGCGPGRYYAALRGHLPDIGYRGVDFSPGMIKNHPSHHEVMIADAQALPFEDDSFDVVMANHMLFHVYDIETAINEFRRVLKPGGVLMATTNSANSMPEFQVLLRRAITLLVPPNTPNVRPPAPPDHLFTLESGTRLLSRHFFAVVRCDLPSTFVFPTVDPVMDYLESTRSLREPQLPPGVAWKDVMVIVRDQVNHLLSHLGELVVNKVGGVLIATDSGGFIHDFVEQDKKLRVEK